MVFCRECGAENEDNAVYCKECGVKQVEAKITKKKGHKEYYIIFVGFILLIIMLSLSSLLNLSSNPDKTLPNVLFIGGIVLFFLFLIVAIILKK